MKKYKKVLRKIWKGLKKGLMYIVIAFTYVFRVLSHRRRWNTMDYKRKPFELETKLVLIDEEENPELYNYTKQQIIQKQKRCRDNPNSPECQHPPPPYI